MNGTDYIDTIYQKNLRAIEIYEKQMDAGYNNYGDPDEIPDDYDE